MSDESECTPALVVRRAIRASARRLFEAWTRPEQLRAWWGPSGVHCSQAEVDLRVGGHYRIVNALPSGDEIIIAGVFTLVDAPTRLAYTWNVTPGDDGPQLVTVRFERIDEATTEVVVSHERITNPRTRESHLAGWDGCLDGLLAYLTGAGP